MNTNKMSALHNSMVNLVIRTMIMSGKEVTKSEDPMVDFKLDGQGCKVFSHRLTGRDRDRFVIEYATDTKCNLQLDAPISIYINYNSPKKFYVIDTKVMYNFINRGITEHPEAFKITDTGDVLKNRGLCISILQDYFLKMSNMTVYNIKECRNGIVSQYEPLVNKLTNQFFKKNLMSWEDIKSMAYEGLAIAINTYDIKKSKMSFTQYAAFAIRNNILSSLDDELRTVKLSNYAQKKAEQAGESLFNSVSIDRSIRVSDDSESSPRETVMGMYEDEKFSDGDVYEYLDKRLHAQFNERDCQIFYRNYGFKQYDEEKGKDIALAMGISEGLVSQKIKKMNAYIRGDKDLCEMLAKLL